MKITNHKLAEIPINKIHNSELGTRKFYDEETLDELGKSISENGLIYPIVVKLLTNEEYELVIGSRRLRTGRKLKLETIPAFIISDLDDRGHLKLMLAENLHREDMTPFEEAWAILKLINDYKMNLKSVAKEIGRKETFVRGRIQLLSLPKEVQGLISHKKLGIGHTKILASLKSSENQIRFANVAAKNKLSEEELSMEVQNRLGDKKTARLNSKNTFNYKRISLKVNSFTKWLEMVAVLIDEGKIQGWGNIRQVEVALKELKEKTSKMLNKL